MFVRVHEPSFCISDRVLYPDDRLVKLAEEAAKPDSVFSLEDRIGLVLDAPALAQAGYIKTSSALALVDTLRNEKECAYLRFSHIDSAQIFSIFTICSCRLGHL